jgi:hypothetical protein
MDMPHTEQPPSPFERTDSHATLGPTDAVALAKEVAEYYAAISFDSLASSEGGYREYLYEYLGRAYGLGLFLSQCPSEYRRFKADGFWCRSRQKPKDKNVMKWVVYFTTRATSPQTRNRAGKYAKVLQHYLSEDVLPADILSRIKADGGIDRFYLKLCVGSVPCGLDGDDPEELEGNGPDGIILAGSSVPRRSGAAAKDATTSPKASSKRCPTPRIDWANALLVDMAPAERAQVLEARTATLHLEIGPRDEHGWSQVRGHVIETLGADRDR